MNKTLTLAEKAFVIISFIYYSGGVLILFLSGGISEGDEGADYASFPILNILFLINYAISFCLLSLRWRKAMLVIARGGTIWLLLGVAILSIFWSYSPDLTKTRVVALTGTMIFSLYFASRYSLKEQLHLLGWTFGISVFMSIVIAILLPKYGLMGGVHAGAWRGIYVHKNGLGQRMILSAIVFLILALKAEKNRWILWSFFAASFALMILSRASSPLLGLVIIIGILSILSVLHWRYFFMVPALIALSSITIILYSLAINNSERVAGAFGKNLTLTGRTDFWPLMVDKIWENPWFGYGFGAFWQGFDGPSAYVWNASAFKAPNGHNGYLDLCLELGFVGFSIYAIAFISSFQKAIQYIRIVRTPDGFWPTLLFSYVVLSNLTESGLVSQNNFLFMIQVSTFLSLRIPQTMTRKSLVLTEMRG
jgi:exopolysaccharide production protein ExoQ